MSTYYSQSGGTVAHGGNREQYSASRRAGDEVGDEEQEENEQGYSGFYNAPAAATSKKSNAVPKAAAPSVWNPAATYLTAAASGKGLSYDMKMDMVASALKYSLDQGTAHVIPGLGKLMSSLRVYFAVDNRYVLKKMQRLSFPFFFKHWKRMELESTEGAPRYALPVHDENAFDLYLPFMSLVTYTLLAAICHGTRGEFTPEVLPDVTAKCVLTQILEVLTVKFGFYTMQVPFPLLDLFALTGYKYLGLSIGIIVGMCTHTAGFYVALAYTAASTSYFVLKNLANAVPKVTANTGPKRDLVILASAASQLATMWFLSQTKFLN